MSKTYEGDLVARGCKFGIVVSRFNGFITERLLEGAIDCLNRHGNAPEDREIVRVPGTFEMPTAVRWMVDAQRFDGIITLGAVIRGSTPHFDFVASEAVKGLAVVSQMSGVPVTLGVLTTETIEQAIERAGTKHGNKGWDAAQAAVEMVNLRRRLGEATWGLDAKRANTR